MSPDSRRYNLFSQIDDSAFLNVRTGYFPYYSSHMNLQDVRIINDEQIPPFGLPQDAGSGWYGDTGDITWDNVTIKNFRKGIDMPRRGNLVVRGGYFENVLNLFIDNQGASSVTLDVGDANFGAPSAAVMKALQTGRLDDHWNIYLATSTNSGSPDISEPFLRTARSAVLLVDGQPQHLYFRESSRGYRLDTADDYESRQLSAKKFPESILALTSGDLWDRYSIAVNGIIAPADARVLPGIHGLVSPTAPPAPLPRLILVGSRYTNQVDGYTLRMRDGSGHVIDLATVDLVPNAWNFVSVIYDGRRITEPIYARTTPPTLQLTDSSYRPISLPTTISRSELEGGYTVLGLVDTSIGKVVLKTGYKRTFQPQELVVDPDGKVRLLLTFSDLAGNTATLLLVLEVR